MNEDVRTSHEDKSLIEALENGQTAQVLEMLAQGANPNSSAYGNTALTLAIALRNKDVIQALLDKGAGVNLESSNFGTPLVAALDRELLQELIEDLLRRGANPNQHSNLFNPPLILAAQHGNVSLMSLLLEHNACVDMRNSQGETPLHHATQSGNVEAVRFLLTHGADSTLTDLQGLTPVDWASNALSSAHNGGQALEVVSAFTPYELLRTRDIRTQAFLALRRLSGLPSELIGLIARLVDPRLEQTLFPQTNQSGLNALLTNAVQEGSHALTRWYMLLGAHPLEAHVDSALAHASNARDSGLIQWFRNLGVTLHIALDVRKRNSNPSASGNQPVIDTHQALSIIIEAYKTAHIII